MLKKLFSSLTSPLTSHLFFSNRFFIVRHLWLVDNAVAESSSLSPTLLGRLILLLRLATTRGDGFSFWEALRGFYDKARGSIRNL